MYILIVLIIGLFLIVFVMMGLRAFCLLFSALFSLCVSLIPFPFLGLPGQWTLMAIIFFLEFLLYFRYPPLTRKIIYCGSVIHRLTLSKKLREKVGKKKGGFFRKSLRIIMSPESYLRLRNQRIIHTPLTFK